MGRKGEWSPGRKTADVFAGREVGEGGRARRRKRKPWGSKREHRASLPNKWQMCRKSILVSQEG